MIKKKCQIFPLINMNYEHDHNTNCKISSEALTNEKNLEIKL